MSATVTEMLGGFTNGGARASESIEPFSLINPGERQGATFSPMSAGSAATTPTASSASTSTSSTSSQKATGDEMIVVPAGLLGGILGAIGGVVGQIVGGSTGNTISTVSGVVGTVLPFSTVPGTAAADGTQEDLVAVPAGLLGGLVGGLGGLVGKLIGGRTGEAIGQISGTVGSLLPMASGPNTGESGTRSPEDLVLVPAGLFGSLIKIVSDVGGRAVGGGAGDIIGTVGGVVGDLLPFSTIPDGGGAGGEMVVLPAGLFGDLVGAVGGLAGHFIGGKAGQVITDVSQGIKTVAPFSVIPRR